MIFYRKAPLALSVGRDKIKGKQGADLDHGLAEDVRERLALEARGGEARGYDPHRAAAEPARPAVQVRRGGGRRGRHAERQPMDYPRAAAGGRRGRGVRRRRADRHRGVGTVPARLDPRAELSTDTDTLARGTRVHDRTIAIRFSGRVWLRVILRFSRRESRTYGVLNEVYL